jgi:hypothetical protein
MKPIHLKIKSNSIIGKMTYISKLNQLGIILCNNKLKIIK